MTRALADDRINTCDCGHTYGQHAHAGLLSFKYDHERYCQVQDCDCHTFRSLAEADVLPPKPPLQDEWS